jgi:hypothetical protein
LIRFLDARPVRYVSQFRVNHAEEFVRHLRPVEVSPNRHRNTKARRLLDKGVQFILECCRALFAFAARRRHLPPYADNPFARLQIDRIPLESRKLVTLLTPEQETSFVETCDTWQFPSS